MEDKPVKEIRIARLTSVSRVGVEIGRVYRAARTGKIRTEDGARLVNMLMGMKACLETADVERRLEMLERAADTPTPTPLRRVV